jgi:hypothetical protein
VINLGPLVLAQTDEHHLHQPAFDVADEIGVGLDAIADHDMVGAECLAVEMDVESFGSLANDHGFHTGPDRTTAELLGHAIGRQHRALAFGRAAPMTPHGGHNEGHRAQSLHNVDHRLGDDVDVRHAPTAHGDRHTLAGLDRLIQAQLLKLLAHLARNVSHARALECLSQAKDRGES